MISQLRTSGRSPIEEYTSSTNQTWWVFKNKTQIWGVAMNEGGDEEGNKYDQNILCKILKELIKNKQK